MVKIVQNDESVLREKAAEIPQKNISAAETQKVMQDMKKALATQKFGVAIAAPQIGHGIRMFVVRGTVFSTLAEEEVYDPKKHPDQVFINPEILKLSKKKAIGDEGCLSVPGKYGTKVERPDKITISYYDENGNKHERGASGFLARVLQHEIDHLNGILYTDHALEVIDVDDELKPLDADYDIHAMRERRLEQ